MNTWWCIGQPQLGVRFMTDRDAWIYFACAIISRQQYLYVGIAADSADEMMKELRKRDKQLLFDQSEGSYRNAPDVR